MDLFVTHNAHDRAWAEWIAWQLEDAGFSVITQAWDFVGNWVIKMDPAMREAQRAVAVIALHYTNSEALFTHSECANAFRLDPNGEKDLLIPITPGYSACALYIALRIHTLSDPTGLTLFRERSA